MPTMTCPGYLAPYASAVEACASTGGTLISRSWEPLCSSWRVPEFPLWGKRHCPRRARHSFLPHIDTAGSRLRRSQRAEETARGRNPQSVGDTEGREVLPREPRQARLLAGTGAIRALPALLRDVGAARRFGDLPKAKSIQLQTIPRAHGVGSRYGNRLRPAAHARTPPTFDRPRGISSRPTAAVGCDRKARSRRGTR